jgi:outer membrane protein assembly factor BamD
MFSKALSAAFMALGMAALLGACATKTKNLDTPEGTLIEAQRLMTEEFHEEARTQFLRIKTEFPTSALQVKADLGIADSHYQEESYPAAATAYEDFIRTYPGREEVPYALFQLGMSWAQQIPGNSERDSRPTEKALDVFSRLLVDFPNSKYRDDAWKWVNSSQAQLAEKAFSVANFYEKQDKYLASAIRYQRVFDLYPDNPLAEEARARRIRMLRKAGKTDEASAEAENFTRQFPESKFKSMIAQ